MARSDFVRFNGWFLAFLCESVRRGMISRSTSSGPRPSCSASSGEGRHWHAEIDQPSEIGF